MERNFFNSSMQDLNLGFRVIRVECFSAALSPDKPD